MKRSGGFEISDEADSGHAVVSVGRSGSSTTAQPHVEVLRREFLDGLFVLVGIFSPEGILTEINERALEAFGLSRDEILGTTFLPLLQGLLMPQSVQAAANLLGRALQGESARGELMARFAGGGTAVLDCTFRPLRDAAGRISQIAATGVDITSHKAAEVSLARLNRALSMLSGANRMLIRAPDEQSLLDNLCRIIVEDGGYALAWVGLAAGDAPKSVRAVASAGRGSDYVRALQVSWADCASGRGPTGRAIRERSTQVCRNIDSDPAIAPWREEARGQGFQMSVALPLIASNACCGALNIYSSSRDSFDAAELVLLEELARDLGYGIEALRTRQEKLQVQDRLNLFRVLLQQTKDMIYVVDARNGRVIDTNDSGASKLGYTREELLQLTVADFSQVAALQSWEEVSRQLKQAGTFVSEGVYRTKSGTTFPVEFSVRYIEYRGREYMIGVTRDISERHKQVAQIERLTRILRMHGGINAAVLRIQDPAELLQEACRLAIEVGGYDRAVFSLVEPSGMYAIPKFRAGTGTDFPEPARLNLTDETALEGSLSGRALRTGRVAVSADLTRPDPPVAMRERLVELGYRAMAALPLIVEGRRVGALVLTSRDEQLVADGELLVLLQDMMASLSFALRSMEHAEKAEYLAYFDPLTGLAKRSLFLERLSASLKHVDSVQGDLAVVALDVRGLNRVNDIYGRHFGDLILQRIAERLRAYVRSDAHIGYFGGGTFALVDPPLTSGEDSTRSVLDASLFGEPIEVDGQSLRMSCSYGVAHSARDGSDAAALVQRAEAALKQAKESGERYLHYQLEMHSQIAQRLELEHRLSAAIAEQQFELYYQPKVELKTGRIREVEGLLRWKDPERGLIRPEAFLPILESTGMILTVGAWVLARAVEDCQRWQRAGVPAVRVAINISSVQLRQRMFVQEVLEQCKRLRDCKGYGLDLEITESVLLQDLEGTSRKLRELRSAGVRIALDDFGTGYSSMGLLSSLPVDLLKVDRSFVKGLPSDASSVVLVETILRLAAAFKLTTVVEGVETEAQLRAVGAMPCDMWQGYLHSEPMPAADLARLLMAN